MLTLDQKVRPYPEVVDTALDGQETVLLHLERKLYYSLNDTGTRIWRGLKDDLTLREISRRLQADYEVSVERADHSVFALVTDLLQQQLVQIPE